LFAVVALVFAASSRAKLAGVAQPMRSAIGSLIGPTASALTPAELQSRIELTHRQIRETIAALEQKTDLIGPIKDTAVGLGSLGVTISSILRNESGRRQ
jgi:hypothetical protein